MSRSLPAALSTELNATELKPFYAIELAFDSDTLRFWTGYGNITANSEEWVGSGTVLTISTSSETTDLAANGINITLSGLDTSLVALALLEIGRAHV